jgi:ferrochelatase
MNQSGILLINLGSPDSAAPKDVRSFLKAFLMDERVLDIPAPLRNLIVRIFILPFRSARSARAYQSIWWETGSPLMVISKLLRNALQDEVSAPVALGMRYGNPSILAGLHELAAQGARQVFTIPLFPQYAKSTFETAVVAVRQAAKQLPEPVKVNFMPPFYGRQDYLSALVKSARPYLEMDFDHMLFSFHGLPERHLKKTDPTRAHCLVSEACCETPSSAHETCYLHQVHVTTRDFLKLSGVPPQITSIAFQSRLGQSHWLAPYTHLELARLARNGVRRMLVICPAFSADCLETLEEIGLRGRETFLAAGGEQFTLIPCLNDHPAWVRTLKSWCNQSINSAG